MADKNHTIDLTQGIIINTVDSSLLTINSNGTFLAESSDVQGAVNLGGSGSHKIKSIGVGGDATVGLKDTASVTVTGDIGSNSTSNTITVDSGASLIHSGSVLGTLNITNNSGSPDGGNVKLNDLGDGTAGAGVELIVSGAVQAGNIKNGTHQIKGQNGSNGTVIASSIGHGGGLQTDLTIGDGTEAAKATVKVSDDIYMAGGEVKIDVKSGSTLAVLEGGAVRGIVEVLNNSGAAEAKGANAHLGIIDGSVTGGTLVTIGNDVSAASLEKGTVTIKGNSASGKDKLYVAAIGTDSAVTDLTIGSGNTDIITVEATDIIGNTNITSTQNGNLTAGTAVGDISIHNGGTAFIESVGRAGADTVLTVSGANLNVGALAGLNTTVKAAAGSNGFVTLKDVSTQNIIDLGQTDAASAITLGGDAASVSLTVSLRDIVGGPDGSASTTVNLDSKKVVLYSTNNDTVSNTANVSGQVNINLIGPDSSDLVLGILKAGSVFSFDSVNAAGNSIAFANGIEGGSDEDHATTINLKNITTLGGVTNMTSGGYYALKLEGTTRDQDTVIHTVGNDALDTDLALGGTNGAALITITDLIGGSTGTDKTTAIHINGVARMGVANAVTGNVDIANNSAAPVAVRLSEMGDGRLRVGGAGEVMVNKIDAASGLTIASLAGEQGMVTLDLYSAGGGGLQAGSKVSLQNAVLKLAADNSGLAALGGDFGMDSSAGESRLAADGDPAQAQLVLDNAPTVTVGAGGDAVIETKSLLYNQALKTAVNQGESGRVYFADSAGDSRMVFKSSDNTNTFDQGVEIDGGRWEFSGATTFNVVSTTPSGDNYITNAEVYFTGLDAGGASFSNFTINGTAANNTIDASGSTLHLNKAVNLAYLNGGALDNLNTVVVGDESYAFVNFGANTILTSETMSVGDKNGSLGNLSIGGGSRSPAFSEGLNVSGSAELAGRITVDGTLTLYNNGTPATVTVTGQNGGFILTGNSLNSSIEQGTSIQIASDLYNSGFQVIHFLSPAAPDSALAALIAEMASQVTVDTSNLGNALMIIDEFGDIYYHAFSVDNPMLLVPKFAREMVAAANSFNPALGMYLLGGADPLTGGLPAGLYNRELTRIMGNTLNSSMMVKNGSAEAFNHLNSTLPDPARFASGASDAAGYLALVGAGHGLSDGLWLLPGYSYRSMDGNYKRGYGDFDVKSAGFTLGYDRWLAALGRAGVFFSYNAPKLDGRYQDIEADDLQFGLYGQGLFKNGFVLNAALAAGWQDYSSERSIRLSGVDGFDQDLEADYQGHSFNLALEAGRPIYLENGLLLRPSLGYTYQRVHLDAIRESSNLAAGNKNLAQRISSSDLDLHLLRLGSDIGWSNAAQSVGLTGRAYWVANLGDRQPKGKARFVQGGNNAAEFKVLGAEYDKNMANLGLGLQLSPASVDGLSFSLDYDALLGCRLTSHTVGLGFSFKF